MGLTVRMRLAAIAHVAGLSLDEMLALTAREYSVRLIARMIAPYPLVTVMTVLMVVA